MDFTRIRNFEKVMKVLQYLSRVINASLKNPKLKKFYSTASFGRRLLRAVKHFNVARTILSFFQANWKKNGKHRFFKFLYYACMYIFLACDLVILMFKLKVFSNRKTLIKIFDFVDKVWIVQNSLGIVDALILANDYRNQRNKLVEEMNGIIMLLDRDSLKETQQQNQIAQSQTGQKSKENEANHKPGLEKSQNAFSGDLGNDQGIFFDESEMVKRGSWDLTNQVRDRRFSEEMVKDEQKEQEQLKLALERKILQKAEIEKKIVIQAKYIIKLFSEIFLAFGFLYSKKVGERIIGFSGLISALSVF